jgi:hypothetical protein
MDIIFDLGTLLEVFRNYGMFAGSFVGVLVLLVKFVIGNYSKWKKEKPNQAPPVSEIVSTETLESNLFFATAQHRMMIEIPSLDLIASKPIRERVFKDLLIISFQAMYDLMRVLVSNKTLVTDSSNKWIETVSQVVNSIMIVTEENARKAGIPEVVIKKYSRWYGERIDKLHEYVFLLGASQLYHTNILKTNVFLMMIDLLLVSTLGDVENVIGEINGELTGLSYKGFTIE